MLKSHRSNMYIPSYKVHNVLKVYSEQLRQRKISEQNKFPEQKSIIKGINKSSGGKCKAVIKKVADEIFDRIIRCGIHWEVDNRIAEQQKKNGFEYTQKETNEFIFNTIDDNNKKNIGKLLLSDVSILIKRPEQI